MVPSECPTDEILDRLQEEIKDLKLSPNFIKSDSGYFSPPDTVYYTCDTLRHELIHFLDYKSTKMDMTNALHVACSEIRANAFSGDCDAVKELRRGYWPNFENCVKRRSKYSVSKLGLDSDQVDYVYNKCIRNKYPFK